MKKTKIYIVEWEKLDEYGLSIDGGREIYEGYTISELKKMYKGVLRSISEVKYLREDLI